MRISRPRVLGVSSVVLAVCLAPAGLLWAQFDETFDDDPFNGGGWTQNGFTTWVPPGVPLCVDPNTFDPADPCTVDEAYDGYILVTDPVGNRSGNAFRDEKDTYDTFKLTVEVELRDGSLGRPADGMVVVVVGGETPPDRTGTGGGGMGAPCVAGGGDNTAPQLAWEFDNWSCNGGDSGRPGITGDAGGFPDAQWSHVAFSYSGDGFACTDAIQPQVFFPFRTADVPLHNKQPAPAEPNRFLMTVYAQNCGGILTVACDLEAVDQDINLGRVYTHTVEDFVPFEGYLGVTASTGGAWQNHILHSAKLEPLPPGFCLQPAARGVRSFAGPERTVETSCGDFQPGDDVTVSVTLRNVRTLNACCPAAGGVTVTDEPPAGWAVSNISDGGTFNGTTITWVVGTATEGKALTYRVSAPDTQDISVSWGVGTVIENVVGAPTTFVSGANAISKDQGLDECGAIRCWNILGAYTQLGGAAPGDDVMRMDYLSDGGATELDFVFEPGAEIATDYNGASLATGLLADGNGRNPDGPDLATVFAYNIPDSTGFVNLNSGSFQAVAPDVMDNVMAYAQVYVISDTDQDVYLGVSSDDGVLVILNKEEVHINSIGRDSLGAAGVSNCSPQDVVGPVTLNAGENELIVKIFEGGGDWDFSVRFQDDVGTAITDGITLSKYPATGCRRPPFVANRTVNTGVSVPIGARLAKAWNQSGQTVDVSVAISDIAVGRAAPCPSPVSNVTVTETVPVGWTPSLASNGGVIADRTITWTLAGAVAAQTLTYKVTTGSEYNDGRFTSSIVEPGNALKYQVGGDRDIVFAPPLFARGNAVFAIDENFDAYTGEVDESADCPDNWTCNGVGFGFGTRAFRPGVTKKPNHEGRLRLANETGTLGTTVIWNDPIDLANNSFIAEFDVFIATTTAATPADGMTFMVLDASVSDATALGGAGGGTGYAGLSGFAVEFDIWDNDGDAGPQEPSGYNSLVNLYGHIGLVKNGVITPHVQHHVQLDPTLIPTSLGGTGWPEFVDTSGVGYPLHCEVDYNNGNIQVYLSAPATGAEPALPRTKVIDTIITFAGTGGEFPVLQSAYLGFSAGTGGAWAIHEADDVQVRLFPATGGPAEICNNGTDDDGDTLIDCADPNCATDLVSCPPGTPFHRGDADSNNQVQLTDAVRILNFLFQGTGVILCSDAADSDDNGQVQLTDAVRILNFLFQGTGVIPAPGPTSEPCGIDPTDDALDCAEYANC